MMPAFQVSVPATTANLGPGFDCLGLALKFYNTIEVRVATDLRFKVRGVGAGELAEDETNLVWQAACHLWGRLNHPVPKLSLTMHNNIPLSSGLGSSSSAIVAGLMLANQVVGNPLPRQDLLEMAAEIEGHPDNVAPALLGGLVVAAVRGKQVLTAGYPWPHQLRLVVCTPALRLATLHSRGVLPLTIAHADAVFNVSRVALLLAALTANDFDLLGAASDDRLHEPYRLALIPGAAVAKSKALAAGAVAAMISGAGPSLLALVPADCDATAVGTAMQSGFSEAGIAACARLLEPDIAGASVVVLLAAR